MAIGAKFGGRKKGTPNKVTASIAEKLAAWACDPFKTLAAIADGDLACNVCRGKGKTRYQAAHDGDRTFERTCQSCYGSKFEKVSPAERGKAAAELAQYIAPKRKAIEHSGPEGGPMQAKVTVEFVGARETEAKHVNGVAKP